MDKKQLDIWRAVFDEELRQQQAANNTKPTRACRQEDSRQVHPHHNG